MVWMTDARIALPETGYADFIAVPGLNTFRRLPWEENVPYFFVKSTSNGKDVSADDRSRLKSVSHQIGAERYQALLEVCRNHSTKYYKLLTRLWGCLPGDTRANPTKH